MRAIRGEQFQVFAAILERAREWTEDDMALVTEVADQAAQALALLCLVDRCLVRQ